MVAVKAVAFQYEPDEAVGLLLETFRMMVNQAIWKGRRERVRGRIQLVKAVYEEFKDYGLHSHYTLSACEVACAILKNSKRSHRAPVARRLFMKLDDQTYRLQDGTIRIPTRPREFLTLKLRAGEYHDKFLKDPTLRRGSITLTEQKLIVAFEKAQSSRPDYASVLALDTNELSLDGVLSNRLQMKRIHTDLDELARIRATHFERRRRLQRRLARCQRKLSAELAKDRGRERRRIDTVLHCAAKQQVGLAKENQAKMVLEDLKGLRRSFNTCRRRLNPRNGKIERVFVHSKALKRRLNSWPFRRLHQFIEYKASWAGVPLDYVPPWNTSRTCVMCGCLRSGHQRVQDPKTRRTFTCPRCGWRCDRHLNAALNLLKTQDEGRWFSPDCLLNEAITTMRAYEEEVKTRTDRKLDRTLNVEPILREVIGKNSGGRNCEV